MKKIYNTPKTIWAEIDSQELIAESFGSTDLNGTSNGGKTSTGNVTEADARTSTSLWDQEW